MSDDEDLPELPNEASRDSEFDIEDVLEGQTLKFQKVKIMWMMFTKLNNRLKM